jgi:hypothetical protein
MRVARHEGRIGRADGVRLGLDVKAGVSAERDTEAVLADMARKHLADARYDNPMQRSRGLHLEELAGDELRPVRLVAVIKQFLRGHGTKRAHDRTR